MLCKTPIALAILAAFSLPSPSSFAQSEPAANANANANAAELPVLGELTVTATRTERRIDDIPATVTVVPASAIERSGARDIKDVFRNELGARLRGR